MSSAVVGRQPIENKHFRLTEALIDLFLSSAPQAETLQAKGLPIPEKPPSISLR